MENEKSPRFYTELILPIIVLHRKGFQSRDYGDVNVDVMVTMVTIKRRRKRGDRCKNLNFI